ncbi:hypothetical protein, partial [Piscinibacter sakaiensis]|uniref:hypothetical protein n=2 Tax=Piscinibacter sakaiensis TaxID=1547922 RepID=UPI0012FB4C9D
MPTANAFHLPISRTAGVIAMRDEQPEFHRIEATFVRFPVDFWSLGSVRTDFSQAAHAHQVVGGHGQ